MMKKGLMWGICLLAGVVFCLPAAWAGERPPMDDVGWHYTHKDAFQEWKAPKEGYDPRMFDQDVIESYGYEAKSVEEIKDLLPDSLYTMMANPDTWGPIRVNVTELKEIKGEAWERYKAETEKYKGTVSVDQNGWIQNYKAGCPFPEPKNGIELVWNFKKAYAADDRIFPAMTAIVNDKHQVRYLSVVGDMMYFNKRLMVDPKPLYEPNPDNLDRVDAYANVHPYELQGTLSVIKQFNDINKDDELFMYLPALRRVRHLSTAQRTDKLPGGQDVFWDCFDGFNGNVKLFTFKSLGQRPMLVCLNGHPRGEFIEGEYHMAPNDYFQKVNVWVNEIRSTNPNYPYSKILHYLDPQTWNTLYSDWYDEKGELSRASLWHYTLTKTGFLSQNVMNHIDIARVHGSLYAFTNAVAKGNTFNIGLTADYFLLDNLRTTYPSR